MSKISDLPVLTDAKGNAYIPVVDPDETDPALQNKRIYLSTLSAEAASFDPYEPDKEYSNIAPDYVSYTGNIYEYIYATPATGIPPTNTSYWKIASAGQFNHVQNTDLGTRNYRFDVSYSSQNQDVDGITILGMGTQQGGKVTAIGLHWFNDGAGDESYALKICYNYTTTGVCTWQAVEGFEPIPEDFYGTHPEFNTQAELNAYLLGGTYVAPVYGASATPESDTVIELTWIIPE